MCAGFRLPVQGGRHVAKIAWRRSMLIAVDPACATHFIPLKLM